jgi:hypothetical protein
MTTAVLLNPGSWGARPPEAVREGLAGVKADAKHPRPKK